MCLHFPGIFQGALDARATRITDEMKIAAAHAIADYIKKPQKDQILPNILDKDVTQAVAKAVAKAAENCGCSRKIEKKSLFNALRARSVVRLLRLSGRNHDT